MLFLSVLVAQGDDKRFNDGAKSTSFFVVAGCGYLGLAVLLGIWVRPESWIVVGCICIVATFLATIATWLQTEENKQQPQHEEAL